MAAVSAVSRTMPSASAAPVSEFEKRLRKGAMPPVGEFFRQPLLVRRGQDGDVLHIHGVPQDLGIRIGRPTAGADRTRMAGIEQQQHLSVLGDVLHFLAKSLAERALATILCFDPMSTP